MVHNIRMVGFNVTYSYNGFVEHFGMFCMFQHFWPFKTVHRTVLHFVCGYRHNFELSSIQSLCFIISEKNSRGDNLCHTFQILAAKPVLDSSQKSRIIKLSNPSLSGAEQAVMFDVKKEGCLMATSVRMHESDKVFVFYSTIYVCTCELVWVKMCMNIRFDLWIFMILFLYLWACLCVVVCIWVCVFMLMCAGVIEAVLQHTVWCLQPESCHKQSAPASVKQQAWENWVLYTVGYKQPHAF